METYKKMEWKLIDITLPRMEYQTKSSNTQRDKGTLIKTQGFLNHSRTQENHSH